MTGALRRRLAAVAAAGLVVLTAPGAAAGGPVRLKSRLLSVSELPAGWSATHQPSGHAPGPCGLSVFRSPTKHGSRVTAQFVDGTTTAFEEGLASGQGELSRWRALGRRLSTCHQATSTEDGTVVHLTIGAMSFPKVSRTSKAFAMTARVTGVGVGFDVVLFRASEDEGFALYGTLGSPTVSTVEKFAEAAVDKAEGKPVLHLATGTVPPTATG